MDTLHLSTSLSLDALRPRLEALAAEQGLVLDFLMRVWNGRMATYNLGVPTAGVVDPRRGGRSYRLIGRLKFNTARSGQLAATLSPPTSCDPTATPGDEARFATFVAALRPLLDSPSPERNAP